MTTELFKQIFTDDTLTNLFSIDKSDQFFDALYGDADEGAYDISLIFNELRGNNLVFEFQLKQRPGKCLACNLTYGLPEVFSRHPVINIKKIVSEINNLLDGHAACTGWEIGATREVSRELHTIPLVVTLVS